MTDVHTTGGDGTEPLVTEPVEAPDVPATIDATPYSLLTGVGAATFPPVRRPRRLGLVLACTWLGLMVLLAISADWLPLHDPNLVTPEANLAPFSSASEPLGTDHLGRSILARAVFGARVSLTVAVVATAFALVIGTTLGLLAGFRKGVVSTVIDLLTDAVLAIPPVFFLLALAAVLEPSLVNLVAILAVLAVPLFVRIARANTIVYAQRPFVVAARALGAGGRRIAIFEILPNILRPVLSFSLIAAATLVIAEASLSFLGLGVRPPTPSWGLMIYQGRGQLATAPHGVFVPAAILTMTIFSMNVIGDWARSVTGRGAR